MRRLCLLAACLMALFATPASADQALNLNGTNQLAREGAVVSGPTSGLDLLTFTVEAWIFPTVAETRVIASDSAYVFRVVVDGDASGIQLELVNTNGNQAFITVADNPGGGNHITFNQWNHVAASYSSATNTCVLAVNGNVRTFLPGNCLDGSLGVNFDIRFGIGTIAAGNASGSIGPDLTNGVPGGVGVFAGRIFGFRVSNTVRYTADFTPACPIGNDAATVALWPFQESAGTMTFTDASGHNRTLFGFNAAATVVTTLPCMLQGGGGEPWQQVTMGDFNGDDQADILWRNSSSGQVAVWLLDGTTVTSVGVVGTASADWVIQGIGDFNDDGNADILWRNSTSGLVLVWLLDGSTVLGINPLAAASADWVIQGVGDFNGNGTDDVLWRNSTSGLVYVWLITGATVTSQGSLAAASADWVIQAIGDFNGNMTADVLWRNNTSGLVYGWLLNGAAIVSQGPLAAASADWVIQGVGTFNAGLTADVLWRNTTSGLVYIWFLNGLTIASQGSVAGAPAGWDIHGIGDLDDNGTADVLWRNDASGLVYAWFLNALVVANQGAVAAASAEWVVEPGP